MRRILVLPGLLLLSAMALLIGACGIDKEQGILMAAGSYGDLAVLMPDDESRPMVDRFLSHFNANHTFVIKEEPAFTPDVFGPGNRDLAEGYKNVLMLVVLGDGGKVTKEARKVVSRGSWQKMEEAGGGIVRVNDPWSTYQLAVVVAARDRNSLGSVLIRNADNLRGIFEKSNRERILRRNRYDGLNEQLMNSLWQRFGIMLEMPQVYTGNQSEPDGFPGVEIMRSGPSRGITVSWQESEDPAASLSDRELLLDMRSRMGTAMHDEDLVPSTFVWSDAEIGGVACVKLEGAWNSRRFAGGGPFWCYFIPDPARQRLFCLDLLVFAPGMDKMVFFRRMDAIASTFATERPRS